MKVKSRNHLWIRVIKKQKQIAMHQHRVTFHNSETRPFLILEVGTYFVDFPRNYPVRDLDLNSTRARITDLLDPFERVTL